MRNKVLKLCKRMYKVTASEIAPILMVTEAEAEAYLDELATEDKLTVREDLIYFYKEQSHRKSVIPVFFEYREKKDIDFLLKCFSCEVPAAKAKWITGFKKNAVYRFYSYFRELLYNKQLIELNKYYNEKPQIPCERDFCGKINYMYFYNNTTYISNKKLINIMPEKPFDKSDMLEFKKDYSKLKRRVSHNTLEAFIHFHLAEQIYRLNNNYDDLYNELKSIMYDRT